MKRQNLLPVKSHTADYIAVLYHNYAKRLYNKAFKYTSDYTIAEDAVQRVFEKALLYPSTILSVPENEIYFFLSAMLRNTIFTILTEERKNYHFPLDYDNGEGFDLTDPSDAYMHFINVESTKQKISMLRSPLRDTILFHYVYGFTYKEIAAMFHISERAVKKRIAVAKKELRTMFRKEDFYER